MFKNENDLQNKKPRETTPTGLKTCESAHDLILTYLVADINMYND